MAASLVMQSELPHATRVKTFSTECVWYVSCNGTIVRATRKLA